MRVRRADGSVIACAAAGAPAAAPLLVCHGLADSRLSVSGLAGLADDLGLRIVIPDRPGTGGTDLRHLRQLADWTDDAALVLDAMGAGSAALLGISGGGPFAAACAARLAGRVSSLSLISPLGALGWPNRGMAPGERASLALARRMPAFGGWFLGGLAALAGRAPRLFLRVATAELPAVDCAALHEPGIGGEFVAGYLEAFRRGSGGVAQDLRVLTRPWGFDLGSISAPTDVHHGGADNTVPPRHARLYAEAIPGARLHVHPQHGHFSILSAARQMLAPLAG